MNFTATLSIILLTFCLSCNNSSSTFPLLSSEPEAATSSQKVTGETVEEVEARFEIRCGPTNSEPDDFLLGGNKAYGCAVLKSDDSTKYSGTVGHLVAKLTSNEVDEGEEQTEEVSSVYASLILADASSKWHFFFQLPEGEYEKVTTVLATAIVDGAQIVKAIEDPQSYNPEGL